MVLFGEGEGRGKSFGKGDDGNLAVERADEFFGRWEYDTKVKWDEDAFRKGTASLVR